MLSRGTTPLLRYTSGYPIPLSTAPTFSGHGSYSSASPPAACHARQPPASTAAAGWPYATSAHHTRAAVVHDPSSYT